MLIIVASVHRPRFTNRFSFDFNQSVLMTNKKQKSINRCHSILLYSYFFSCCLKKIISTKIITTVIKLKSPTLLSVSSCPVY